MTISALRLDPDMDLKGSLLTHCQSQSLNAVYILSCVGSLKRAVIRFAGEDEGRIVEERLEILMLSGTLSQHGIHLHICVSDHQGQVIGGHLMDGSLIYTTAEIVLGTIPHTVFQRDLDPVTGYRELVIERSIARPDI